MKIEKNTVLKFGGLSGILLIYSYYYFLKDKSSNEIEKYWGSIDGNKREFYKLSMFFCVLGMLKIVYDIYNSPKKDFNDEAYGFFLLIFVSMFYLPLTIQYTKKPSTLLFIAIVSTLFFVAIGSLILYKKYPSIGSKYLMFHLFFLDLFYWSYSFFKNY
jgi:hypothetical protein